MLLASPTLRAAQAGGTSATTTRYATEAPSAFISYVVTVESLELVSTTGTKVKVLPAAMQVDLAQVLDLSEAVDSGLVPPGRYVSANLGVSFAGATITAVDASGRVHPLRPVDSGHAPFDAPVTIPMRVNGGRALTVDAQSAALGALDVLLDGSNTPDFASDTVAVATTPWSANVVPSGNSWVHLYGRLQTTPGASPTFTLTVGSSRGSNASAVGSLALQVTPTTTYRLQGAVYSGEAGAAALASLPAGTLVVGTGALQSGRRVLVAQSVVTGP